MDKLQIIEQLFADYCDLTDAQRYFSDEEIQNNIKIPKTLFGNIKTISE